jgi:hypothetical protein
VLFRIILLGIMAISLNAKVVEVLHIGKTYPFAEKDLLAAIHNKIKNNKQELIKKAYKVSKKAKQQIINFKPKGIDPLTPADKVKKEDYSGKIKLKINKEETFFSCRRKPKKVYVHKIRVRFRDLDDGVKVNYCKFKDVLYPIKGLCK